MKTTASTVMAAGLCLAAIGSAAGAATVHSYSYDADSDAARHRTQTVTLTLREGLMGGIRVLHLYRTRGEDFDLKPSLPWSEHALAQALGPAASGALLYQVDPKAGAGFARGACKGAEKAWLAMFPPKPYQPLRIVVLCEDPAAKHAPMIGETLDYAWHGEWVLPALKHSRTVAVQDEVERPK
jgi:hypothetical protein